MLRRCADAVQAAAEVAGRQKLTEAQLQGLEDRIKATQQRLARQDPGRWRGLTADQRLTEGARAAMADIVAEAQRKADNAVRQVMVVAQTEQRLAGLQQAYGSNRTKALKRDMELTHVYATALRREAQGDLMKLIEAAGDKQGAGMGRKALMVLFDAENPGMTRDVVREIFKNADGHTGNDVAKMAARAWLDTIEGLRQRFNAAGGDVGRLDYGYTPQPHDTARVRKVGAEAWARATLPLLDRTRYLLEDGSRMGDDALLDVLRKSWETISTEGLNKSEPGAFRGTGKRANRHSDTRQIHFADGQAWVQYMRQFGSGSLYDAMMSHVAGMTRDIALVERYGPDIQANARLQFDLAARADGTKPENLTGKVFAIEPQTYWDMITGVNGTPVNERLAQGFSIARNLQTASKLGGAVISSITDLGTIAITTGYNRLPYWQLVQNIGSQASKETRQWMAAHGMIAESVADSLNRWSGDHLGTNWSGKMANSVMRWSLLNAWTDGLRQGFTLTMNAGLARMSRTEWKALTEFDRTRLRRAGITEADWVALGSVPLENFKGRELLTPQRIKAAGHPELAAKVFGFITDEAEYAVVNPDMATRAIVTGGLQSGTPMGEIQRTVMQFKSFPIAMFTRHWGRLLDGTMGADGAPLLASRSAYAFALLASTMGLGAVAVQEKQILQGKDPIDMTKGRFWAKAAAQGGGFGIAGDLFLIDPAGSPGDATASAIKNLAGPTVGTAGELLLKDIVENVWQAAEGKDTHAAAEFSRWVESNTPGASLWWVRPMLQHGVTNAMNESLSPGYLSRMQQRAQKDWGQRYWWAPGDVTPTRAPDLSEAFGG